MEDQIDLIRLDSGDIVHVAAGSALPNGSSVIRPHPVTDSALDSALAHQLRRVEQLKRAHQIATIALKRLTAELTLAGGRLDKLKTLIP